MKYARTLLLVLLLAMPILALADSPSQKTRMELLKGMTIMISVFV